MLIFLFLEIKAKIINKSSLLLHESNHAYLYILSTNVCLYLHPEEVGYSIGCYDNMIIVDKREINN